jgi:hypothetical protein
MILALVLESEYKLRQIIETVPGFLWSTRPDGEKGPIELPLSAAFALLCRDGVIVEYQLLLQGRAELVDDEELLDDSAFGLTDDPVPIDDLTNVDGRLKSFGMSKPPSSIQLSSTKRANSFEEVFGLES